MLLTALIERVRDNRPIAELLSRDVEANQIMTALRPVCAAQVSIDSIAGSESRVDAVLTGVA